MNNLYLIGSRGTGKTTLAPMLAQQLAWSLIEMDDHIAAAAGQSISEIFATFGEAAFRELESRMLQQVAASRQQVVSTGGGIVVRPENRELLRATGLVVWLTASVSVMHQRLSQAGTVRPPLTNLSQLEEIEQVARVRTPFYQACAHFTVDTSEQNPQDSVNSILSYLHRVGTHGPA